MDLEKGKYGISPKLVAILAFVFAALLQPVPVLLIAAFALVAERDKWLNKHVITAVVLMTAFYAARLIIVDWIFGGIAGFFGWFNVLALISTASVFIRIGAVISTLLHIALAVACVVAALRIYSGKQVIPEQLSGLGDRVLGSDVCPSCGAKVKDGANFCPACGKELTKKS
ncbi:MAG: zinc-ribbon domain-containing protein [Oscillospiraceae bacterium]|jgi:hypothetical protein|nr:zinc-ribbon domain-containing protein [Oscillospiraceae bacterium]